MTFVKFCGLTQRGDVARACELGVDAIGLVLWPGSPRYVAPKHLATLLREIPQTVTPVGVFVSPSAAEVDAALEAGIRVIQIHGESTASRGRVETWVAASVDVDLTTVPEDVTLLLDAHDPVRHGGTGRTIDWARASDIAAKRRVMLAGGLTPTNVADAIRQVRPYGVDVSSGIEERPGTKNAHAMRSFITAVREAHHE